MGAGRKRRRWKQDCRGFTLVEIIVVLVILAILAAFTIPAMLGFVEDARGKAYIVEAREIYEAMQSALTEIGTTVPNNLQLVSTQYKFAKTQEADAKGKPTGKYVDTIKPYNPPQNVASYEIAIGKKAYELIKNDLTLSNRAEYALIIIDVTSYKVKSVELHKNGYTATLTSGGTTTVTKDQY